MSRTVMLIKLRADFLKEIKLEGMEHRNNTSMGGIELLVRERTAKWRR